MVTGWPAVAAAGLALVIAILLLRFLYFFVAGALALTSRSDPEIAARGETALFGQTIKQAFGAAVEPLVSVFARSGVHPHVLTFLCVVLSGAAAVLLAMGELLSGGLVATVASLFDYLDGRIARRSGLASLAGSFLDSTGDRVAELALFGGVAVLFRHSAPLLSLTLVASGAAILTSYARAKAESLGVELKSGWLQRPERMTVLCASATLDPFTGELLGALPIGPHPLLALAICLLALLGGFTTLQRLWTGARAAGKLDQSEAKR